MSATAVCQDCEWEGPEAVAVNGHCPICGEDEVYFFEEAGSDDELVDDDIGPLESYTAWRRIEPTRRTT